MEKYYIYAHIRKDTNTIFYIGKGSGNRAYFKANRSKFWKRIVEKHGYSVIFLMENLTEEVAYQSEITFIMAEKLKGNCEANFTKGGDGVRVEKRWWNEAISNSLKGVIRAKGVDNKNYKDVITKENLFDLYINQKKTSTEISILFNISIPTVCKRLKDYNINTRNSGKEKIKIICLNDNKIFDSINDAASFYNIYRENIKKVLSGKYKHTDNKTFKKI